MKAKKTLEYYMSLPYRMEIIPDVDEGGYVAAFPDLPGCITCAETLDGIVGAALDAKKSWLQAALEDGLSIQEPAELDSYSGQFKLRMPKSLHRSLSLNAKKEGISMNQYCIYLRAKNDAEHSRTA